MKNKMIRIIVVLLTFAIVLNTDFAANVFATTNDLKDISDNINQITGQIKPNMKMPRGSNVIDVPDGIRDISGSVFVSSVKAWINGSLIYEKGKEPVVHNSIYGGTSFKLALEWQMMDQAADLVEGDYFTIHVGSVEGLKDLNEVKKESLYINNILVGNSFLEYKDNQITYKVIFGKNIRYFEDIQGFFQNTMTFKDVQVEETVTIKFQTGGEKTIVIKPKPTSPSGGGNKGIGLPTVPSISKDLSSMGKSTYTIDRDKEIFGWRVVFTDFIHKNQANLNSVSNPTYENTIIEDTLDENHEFKREQNGKLSFFFDIPVMLPGTQNAVAYSASSRDPQVATVDNEGNGNSEYTIDPLNYFTEKQTEQEVRDNPLTYAVVQVGNKQKLIINVGKLGTEDNSEGITGKMVGLRYPSMQPISKPYSELGNVIDEQLTKYETIKQDIINNKYSPYHTLKTQYEAFKNLYVSADAAIQSQLSAYCTSFDAYISGLNETAIPTGECPSIPVELKLSNSTYTNFEDSINHYQTYMKAYIDQVKDGSQYRQWLDDIIQGLKDAKRYYPAQGNRIYAFCLKYITTVTNPSTGKVSNSAKITSGEKTYEAEKEVEHSYNPGIKGVFSKGDIVIMKADKAYGYTDSSLETVKDIRGMKDVQFEVYDASTDEKLYFFDKSLSQHGSYQYQQYGKDGPDFTSIVTTDEDGKFVLSGMVSRGKKYYLKEISNSEGYYQSQNQRIEFTVEASKINYKLVDNVARTVTFKKVDKNAELAGTSSVIAGVKFALYNDKNQQINHFKKEIIQNKTYFTYDTSANDDLMTQSDGSLTIKNLPAGQYYFKEIQAPQGYLLSEEKYSFELTKDYHQDTAVVDLGNIYNLLDKDSVSIKKIDEKTKLPILGTSFELYREQTGLGWTSGHHDTWELVKATEFNKNSKYVTDADIVNNALVTNNSGNITINCLPQGDYYFVESNSSYGYVANKKHYHFTVTNGRSQLYASQLEDETNMNKIENNAITNQKGFGSLQLMKYDDFYGASVIKNGISQDLNQVFYDDNLTQINVTKPMMGVKFDLYLQKGNQVDLYHDTKVKSDLVTDKDGKIKVDSLEVGKYYFIEVETLPNYQLKQEPILFEIKHDDVQEDKKTLIRLVDNHYVDYRVVLNKLDTTTKIPLHGAEFELYNSANQVMKFRYNENTKMYDYDENGSSLLVTNQDGQIILNGLISQQKYIFKETKAPIGYQINQQDNLYEVYIKQVDASFMTKNPVITEVTCFNELVTINEPDISQEPGNKVPSTTKPNENHKTPTTSDLTEFGLWVMIVSGCIALALYKRKEKN